jgi:hypothetical protein
MGGVPEMSEPDYEAIQEDRDYERGQAWLERMDARYGRVEDWLKPITEDES